jgi:hypothetical protein
MENESVNKGKLSRDASDGNLRERMPTNRSMKGLCCQSRTTSTNTPNVEAEERISEEVPGKMSLPTSTLSLFLVSQARNIAKQECAALSMITRIEIQPHNISNK